MRCGGFLLASDRCWLKLDKGCHFPFCPFHCSIKSTLQSSNEHNTVHSICYFKCTKENQILSPSSVPFLKMLSSRLLRCFRFPFKFFYSDHQFRFSLDRKASILLDPFVSFSIWYKKNQKRCGICVP